MLTSIRKSNIIKLISGLMLVCITLSFPGTILGSADIQNVAGLSARVFQNQAEKKAVQNVAREKSTAKNKSLHAVTQNGTPIWANHTTQATDTLNSTQLGNSITRLQSSYSQPQSKPINYSNLVNQQNEDDIYLLARVIHAEARGEPFEGQVAIAAVLLNRLNDARFPKTLEKIIFKRGEFCTVRDGQIWMTPNKQSIQAARLAMAGWDPTGGAVYFYNPAKTSSRWMWTRPVINKIGNHFFAV